MATTMHVNVHIEPADHIVIQSQSHTWMRLGDCVIHASDADFTRIRDTIDRYLTARRFVVPSEAEAA